MPPGAAKSTYTSILFVAWYLANMPRDSVIAASNTAELAETWGRRVRNLVAEHEVVLGVGLAQDSQAVGRWETNQGGIYIAAGVRGTITGRRADLAIIDDPIRGHEDADSEEIREKTWLWYQAEVYSRLKPGGRIVLIQTRWHEDDLAGRLLEQMRTGGDRWEVLSFPAIAEENDPLGRAPGEALWPEWENIEALERKRRNTAARIWSALYQQSPAPDDGTYFLAEWFKPYTEYPAKSTLRIYGASDYAVTADGGDYTVHVVVGIDPQGEMYLLDLWRKQAASNVWVEAYCDLVLKWKPIGWAEEQGQIRAGIGPYLDRRARERNAYCARTAFPTRGDKGIRAQSIRGRLENRGLFVPTGAGWWAGLRAELLAFPAGKHDDQVDALGLVGQLLDVMVHGPKPKEPRKPDPMRGYSDAVGSGGDRDYWRAI